jgi:hypothetical protein
MPVDFSIHNRKQGDAYSAERSIGERSWSVND